MAIIKLNRINKGGEILLNSDHILFVEIECRTTTIHMIGNLLFSVVEPLDEVIRQIEIKEAAHIKLGIQDSGLVAPPPQ